MPVLPALVRCCLHSCDAQVGAAEPTVEVPPSEVAEVAGTSATDAQSDGAVRSVGRPQAPPHTGAHVHTHAHVHVCTSMCAAAESLGTGPVDCDHACVLQGVDDGLTHDASARTSAASITIGPPSSELCSPRCSGALVQPAALQLRRRQFPRASANGSSGGRASWRCST